MLYLNRSPSFYPLVRYASLALSLSVLVWSAGCSKGGPKDVVTGKVTLNGAKVVGTVTFIGPDKKPVKTPINPDGSYTLPNPAKGENIILVTGLGIGAGTAPKDSFAPTDKDSAVMKDKTSTNSDMGKPPPDKYGSEATSDLKFTVTGGKQTKDLELTP